MDTAKVIFFPSKISGMVPKGTTILDAARSFKVDIEGPCGGTGKCGRDLVQIRKEGVLHTVLACKTTVETDLEVICQQHEKKSLKIVEGFYVKGEWACDVDPVIRKELMYNEHGLCFTEVYANDDLLFVEQQAADALLHERLALEVADAHGAVGQCPRGRVLDGELGGER